jgi:Fe-S-cluster-containing dehydrogenase component/anaerobic selenocysteine-containing dehydrogenase
MSTASKDLLEELRKDEEKILSQSKRNLWQSAQEKEEVWDTTKAHRSTEFTGEQKGEQKEDSVSNPSRRRFLQFMGAATALMTSTACKRRPVDTLVPYVHKPQGVVSGIPVWYASSAANGYGILVKTREGRPIKVEGNPDHPANQGGLDAGIQACLLDLYNPERVKGTLRNGRVSSWKDSDAQIKNMLSDAKPGAVRVLTGSIISPTLQATLSNFVEVHKAHHHVQWPFGNSEMDAYQLASKQRAIPNYRFEKADVVVSFDQDFLGAHPQAVEFTKQFSKRRKIHRGDRNVNRLFVFESNFTLTGVNADHRHAILPSSQLSAIYAVAHLLAQRFPVDAGIKSFLTAYSPDKIAAKIGVQPEAFKEVADALAQARGRSLVLVGSSTADQLPAQLAGIFLNSILQNYGSTLDLANPAITGFEAGDSYESLLKDAVDGKVDVLIVQGANPVFHQVDGEFDRALAKIKNVIVISQEMNETAQKAQFVLGESHFLESWGDSQIRSGSISIQQPVIEPLFDTRSFGEILATWIQVESVDYRKTVQNFWRKNFYSGTSFDSWWNDQLRKGATAVAAKSKPIAAPRVTALSAPSAKSAELELVLYETAHLRSGAQANNAWLQELPDAISKITWSNYVAISPALAKKMGFREDLAVGLKNATQDLMGANGNDVAVVSVGKKSLELAVHVQPGIPENVIAVALGYGRTNAGAIGSNVGKNALVLASLNGRGAVQLSGLAAQISKSSKNYELASTQRAFELQGRDQDILQVATLSDFLKNPKAAKVSEKEESAMSLYDEKEFVYPGHKWGMAIDLNSCTGCQACVVACYSENNISASGEDQIRKGRHMAWLRLDLYYTGTDVNNPDSAEIQPMLCQQCTNAPCETVCPVLATTHSSDGLNDMVYNRCVGTRYCANNCPYKVRRFNYFQYSDKLGGKMELADPLPMALNPDVTVRSRGVMEKCTFCVQRIRRTVDELKDKKEKLKDGTIQTACQQSCPADAIIFGDLNDPESEVSKLSELAQGFRVLEVLNTRPSVTYLPRIRNKGVV